MKQLAFAFIFSFVVSTGFAAPPSAIERVRPPEPVNKMIWRSGRPTPADLQKLYSAGVRIIINVENNKRAVEAEAQVARDLGMKFYSFPMNALETPNDNDVRTILSLLAKPAGPTLVHCKHGEDRTGVIIALSRVFNEGWKPAQAYEEMLQKGFHKILVKLDWYFKNKTRVNPAYRGLYGGLYPADFSPYISE